MGFFSFKTTDTGRSISNRHSHLRTFPVTLVDNKGNIYRENNYEGYGIFGGKDIFILIAEMNGYKWNEEVDPDFEIRRMRDLGIDLYHSADSSHVIHPNIFEGEPQAWNDVPLLPCEYQGYFY
jgi:hypothetical protein